MIKADMHTHSTYSTDADNTLQEMVCAAIAGGLSIYCITEHMDYDNHNYMTPHFCEEFSFLSADEQKNAFICSTQSYYNEYLQLKEQYQDQIELRFGMELGLQPHLADFYKKYISEWPFDFLIGSTHEADNTDPFYPEFIESRTPEEAYISYFKTELLNIKNCIDSIDVCGHIDYALRYHIPDNYEFEYNTYSDILDELLKILIENGKGIELNTGGFSYFGTEPNPRLQIIKRYRELGGEIITIGSDAHKTTAIARHFDKAENILKECGFKYYSHYKNRTPIMIKI